MAKLIAEQLEFDFFSPTRSEKKETPPYSDQDPTPVAKTYAFTQETDLSAPSPKPVQRVNKQESSILHNKDGSLKLNDFGEDLHNTRKGRTVNRSGSGNFLYEPAGDTEKRLAKESLEKVWPKDSIVELYKENPQAAACLWLIRASLSGRKPPKTSYKYRSYLNTASAAIGLHRQIVTGAIAPEAATEAFDRFYEARSRYKTFVHINPKYWPFINPDSIGDAQRLCHWNNLVLSDGSDIDSYKYQCVLPGSGEGNILCLRNSAGNLYGHYAVAVGNTAEEFEANIEKQLQLTFASELNKDSQTEAMPAKPISLYGRGVRKTHTYEVYGKSGSIELQLTDEITFESDDAFWSYIKDHKTELENKYRELRAEYSKTEKDWRSDSPIRDRIGPDYRKGKDATPEMFMNAFGFRGVEFGNWVKQGKNGRERQWMLNNAYDSLLDLAQILGIPPKATALDGELGLCFGSRGFGSASAHYEPENRLINLTKTKGYSSLAHEWFHALDHYMMRTHYKEKLDTKMLSEQVNSEVVLKLTPEAAERVNQGGMKIYSLWPGSASRLEYELATNPRAEELAKKLLSGALDQIDIELDINVRGKERIYKVTLNKEDLIQTERGVKGSIRPELHHVWAETIDAIRASAMHKRMLKKNDYWKSKTEEAARSFEAFVEVRSKQLNIQNDFLTNGAFREKAVTKQSYYPYLDGEDVKKVSDKFKALFEEIKTKETEKGIALFSKTREGKSGAKISQIRAALEKKFGKATIDALIDGGQLKIAANNIEAQQYLSDSAELRNSKKNIKTGYVVPDEFAHKNNPEGTFATLNIKGNLKYPNGEIVVKEGFYRLNKHRGLGAKHLAANAIEFPSRDLFPNEENKTEAALLSLKEVLASATRLYKENEFQYVFYSPRYNRGVPCQFNEKNNTFSVITDRPVKPKLDVEKLWGNDSVRLSGALIFPDHTASVTASSLVPDIEQNLNGTQPVKSHKDLYTEVDYTEEIRNKLARVRSEELYSKKIGGKDNRARRNDSVRLSGALESPDHAASVTASSLVPDIEQNLNGTQPVKSHKDLYTEVDYTEEIRNKLARVRSEELYSKKIGGKDNRSWKNDSVRLSGALIFPDHDASVTPSSSRPDIEEKQTELQPTTSHEDLYTEADYTQEIKNKLRGFGEKSSLKKSSDDEIQGFYDPKNKQSVLIAENLKPLNAPGVLLHEIGIHMAFDSELKTKVISLIKEAPRLLEEGFRQRDPVCMAAEIRLKDAGVTKDHPNYAEEAAAYLVEEAEKHQSKQPAIIRWSSQFRSLINVWLIEHGFRDSEKLTPEDFVIIAKSNIKSLARQKIFETQRTTEDLLNSQNRKIVEELRKELPEKSASFKDKQLLEKALEKISKKLLEGQKRGIGYQFANSPAVSSAKKYKKVSQGLER